MREASIPKNRVAIIGAGISGLTAAIFLQRKNFDVTIYEKAPALAPVGSGIALSANALNVLESIGLIPEIMAAGVPSEAQLVTDVSLKPIQRVEMDWVARQFGQGMVAIRRSDLHGILAEKFGPERIVLGRECSGLTRNKSGARIGFADGSEVEADWVIGADGIHSRVRTCLFGEVPLRYSGQTCFRGMAPFQLPDPYKQCGVEIWGGRFRLGFVSTRPGEVYYFCVFSTPPGSAYSPPAAREVMLNGLADFPPFVKALVAATPDDSLIQTDMYDFPPLARWSDGPVGLIGDAAHATTPNLGQGGAQAIEDGYHLDAFADGKSHHIDFEGFFHRRSKKTARITRVSYWFGKGAHLIRLGALRNFILRLTPQWVLHGQARWVLKL